MYGCPVSFYVWWYYTLSIGLVYIIGNEVYGFFHHLQGISLEPNLWFPTTNSCSSASASTVADSMYCVFQSLKLEDLLDPERDGWPELLMSPLDAGYCGQINESSHFEQGNDTSISNTVQNPWLATTVSRTYRWKGAL